MAEAREWCGSATCGGTPCDRAKRIHTFAENCVASTGDPQNDCVLTPASDTVDGRGRCEESASCAEMDWCTCTYKPERLICTDDMGVFNVSLSHEYLILAQVPRACQARQHRHPATLQAFGVGRRELFRSG